MAVELRDFKGEKVEAAAKIFFASFCGARFLTIRPVRRFMAPRFNSTPIPPTEARCYLSSISFAADVGFAGECLRKPHVRNAPIPAVQGVRLPAPKRTPGKPARWRVKGLSTVGPKYIPHPAPSPTV